MQLDNTLYAAVQIAHNFGAAAAVGMPLAALRYAATGAVLRKTYLLALAAWFVQIASGGGFGLVSYFVVGELPQISGAALVALFVKISCAVLSVVLLVARLLGLGQAVPDKAALGSLAGLFLGSLQRGDPALVFVTREGSRRSLGREPASGTGGRSLAGRRSGSTIWNF